MGPLRSKPWMAATLCMNHWSNSTSDWAMLARNVSLPGPSTTTSTRKLPSGVGCRYARCSVSPWRAFMSSKAVLRGPVNSATQASQAPRFSAGSGAAIAGMDRPSSLRSVRAVVRGEIEPLDARRRTGDAALLKRLAEPPVHEGALRLLRLPDLEHHQPAGLRAT